MNDDAKTPEWGPNMAALANDRQRAFVAALFDAPLKRGRLTFAARAAGYGTPTSSRVSLGVIASRLARMESIQAAIAEESQRRVRFLAPFAVTALERMVCNPRDRNHLRALAMVLERSDPVSTTHNVVVQDQRPPSPMQIEKALARIEELAARLGVPLPPKRPQIIDATASEEART